ncbi:cytochrome-c oxidase, cbb3-type subunit III [Roseisalinus antarcticus]|uniref:Cbb3-type cytochrome c oxidase subunit n=1 Tax=Roseisalinus antarcticus TaxID=254357 RepID=A0A1Y5S8S0_9RHOB|nr:cytochrome-c oxidase, cbb3-type subunit III [Roseisalinus antarcticus]SLN33999.1 Cbb3-type cytochrome c oxidase subunit CcoP [Roseisalinus antarcticus]
MSEKEKAPDTTGHEWDGIKEFDNPLPKWWLWIFYATIVWGVGYTIAYPAWPMINRATAGVLGYSTRANVAEDIAAVEAQNAELMSQLASADLATIAEDETLHQFAVNGGAALFRANCSQCHGSGAAGAKGFPNLIDDAWIWGGRIDEIAWTVANGIRNEDSPDARGYGGMMQSFADILSPEEMDQVINHVLAISGQEHDAELAAAGETVYLDNCASCHGENGEGSLAATRSYEDPEVVYPDGEMTGAPRLSDAIWLYGGSEEAIHETLMNGRAGVMPAWSEEWRMPGLTEAEINAVAAYVHQLGGGQ